MTAPAEFPLPGEHLTVGLINAPTGNRTYETLTVLASAWWADDDDRCEAIFLLMRSGSPYYLVGVFDGKSGQWEPDLLTGYSNITEAAREYDDLGGGT